MKPVSLLICTLIAGGVAHSEVALPAVRALDSMMLTQVYLNGSGPFRMLLDTGAEASTLRPEAAARIGARALYRVEQVTAAGVAPVPAGFVTVGVAGVVDDEVEMIFAPVVSRNVDGVLGQSWLRRHSYLLDFKKSRVVLDGAPPAEGLRVALREADGRPCLTAQVDGEPRELILDSGASALVLFTPPARFAHRAGSVLLAGRARILTNNGAVEAGVGKATVMIGSLRRHLTAAEIPSEAAQHGLLPASAFQSVYIAGDRRLAVLSSR